MNDPTKRIDVEKSSLLSLKAELLRKQEEVLKNKKEVPFVVKTKLKNSSKSTETSTKQSGVKIIESEDSSLIAKSQKILEAKAKYYEKMVNARQGDEHSLVIFNKKSPRRKSSSSDDEMLVTKSVL